MQLLQTVVTYLLELIEHDVLLKLNIYEHGNKLDVDSAYGVCIHHDIPDLP